MGLNKRTDKASTGEALAVGGLVAGCCTLFLLLLVLHVACFVAAIYGTIWGIRALQHGNNDPGTYIVLGLCGLEYLDVLRRVFGRSNVNKG